jgi:enoyl-CoA hydratase
MADPVLLLEKSEGIATLTLNRPEVRNALSSELRAELVGRFRELGDDETTGVVILTGAGQAFCAGLDLRELGSRPGASGAAGEGDIVRAMAALEKPIIGAINGVAVTGGFELALACDVLLTSTEARFADTHARVGILPGWGLSQLLPRVIGPYRAKQLSLTGNYLSAEQAYAWGLTNAVLAPEELLPACRALARDMLSCDPRTLRGVKRLIDDGYAGGLREGLALERERSSQHMRDVTPEMVEERRRKVIERGRAQTHGPRG